MKLISAVSTTNYETLHCRGSGGCRHTLGPLEGAGLGGDAPSVTMAPRLWFGQTVETQRKIWQDAFVLAM